MSPRQREGGARRVVECRRRPGRHGMACFAIGRNFGSHMWRIGRCIVIGLVAAYAGSGNSCITLCMATGTCHADMSPGKGEGGCSRMIK